MPNGFTTPYVSQVYDSPNLVRIADLIQQQGAQRAASVQRGGDLSAQLWNGFGSRISDLIRTPQQVRDQETARQTELTRNALAQEQLTQAKTANQEAQKHISEEDQLGAILKSHVKPDANGQPRYDVEGITQDLPPTMGARGPSLIDSLTKSNQLQDATRAAKINQPLQIISQAARDAYESSAPDGSDALDRFGAHLHLAVLSGQITADQAMARLQSMQDAKDPKRALIGQMLKDDRPKTDIREQAQGGSTIEVTPGLPPRVVSTSPAKPPAVGSFEDYITRTYGTAPTSAQIVEGRKVYQQADDRPRITVNTGSGSDVKEAVAGMKDGTIPPQLPGRASKDYTATMAEAHRQGYDLQAAVTDWNATQKHIASMNGNQQLRLNQAINQLPELLDSVDALASKWKGGRFPILNRANLALAKGGAYGEDVASVARQLDAQIADVTSDLGAVYMGGNSPTDHALGLAAKSLSGEWSEKVLKDMTNLARNNVTIRSNSIKHTGVAGASENNPYAPKPEATPQAPPAPAGWKYIPKAGGGWTAVEAK